LGSETIGSIDIHERPPPQLKWAADMIVAEIRRPIGDRNTPILGAFDGGSGSGKSSVASLTAEESGSCVCQVLQKAKPAKQHSDSFVAFLRPHLGIQGPAPEPVKAERSEFIAEP